MPNGRVATPPHLSPGCYGYFGPVAEPNTAALVPTLRPLAPAGYQEVFACAGLTRQGSSPRLTLTLSGRRRCGSPAGEHLPDYRADSRQPSVPTNLTSGSP